ncbi:MAG: HDOD domain-containing protein [Thermogutta sp.]
MDALLDAVDELHSSPTVAWRVLNLLKDPEFDVRDVESHLEADPALTASILRLVNSAAYGLPRRISSLRQAIMLMGARSLRLAVLSFGLVDRLTRGTPAQVYDDFWRRALTTAVAAARLSREVQRSAADEAYSAGLLADLGVLALAQVDTNRYVKIYTQHSHGTALIEAETSRYGFSHAALGGRLLSRWGIPNPLPLAAANHHLPPVGDALLFQTVYAGTLLADVLWTSGSPLLPQIQAFLERHFDFDLDRFIDLGMECKADIEDAAEMFAVRIEGEIDCRRLRREAAGRFREEAIDTAIDYDGVTAILDQDFSS